MSPDDLLVMLRKRPFVPFRIFVRDGGVYEISHPGMIVPGPTSILIGVSSEPVDDELYGRMEQVELKNILCWESLPERTAR